MSLYCPVCRRGSLDDGKRRRTLSLGLVPLILRCRLASICKATAWLCFAKSNFASPHWSPNLAPGRRRSGVPVIQMSKIPTAGHPRDSRTDMTAPRNQCRDDLCGSDRKSLRRQCGVVVTYTVTVTPPSAKGKGTFMAFALPELRFWPKMVAREPGATSPVKLAAFTTL
jgi:hypothetical protein